MTPDFNKTNGLIPVIIQDAVSMQVLMLGYMNEAAFSKTLEEKKLRSLAEARTVFGRKEKLPAIFFGWRLCI